MSGESINIDAMTLPDPHQLLALARENSESSRTNLAAAITKMLAGELNRQEQGLAAEILMSLLRQAETDLKEALSERLSVMDNVPEELIITLAHDTISVARPVLKNSPLLKEGDLLYIIESQTAEYWQAIAERADLGPRVSNRLADTRDPDTILHLIDNQRIILDRACLQKIAVAAIQSDRLQAPLLRRPEVDSDLAIQLYWCVSLSLRRDLLGRFNIDARKLDESLQSVLQELTDATQGARRVTPDMLALARRFKDRREISPELLIKTLRRQQVAFFIALFSILLDIEPETAEKLLQRDNQKALALACRAAGIMKSDFASIFLLSRGAATGDKIVDQRELAHALKSFDRIGEHNAKSILARWVKDPGVLDPV